MDFREATEQDHQRFNDFVAASPIGDLLQSFEWGELKRRTGWTPIRLIAEDDGRITAAASVLRRRIPRTNRCIMYAQRGPVLDTHDTELVQRFCGYMRRVAVANRAILLKIDPPIPVEDVDGEANLRAAGFAPLAVSGFGGTQPKAVMQLDLDGSRDELIASFKPKWRYNIRLAERKGVQVRMSCQESDLRTFYALLQETCKRDGFVVRGYSYFRDMFDILGPPGYVALAMTSYEGEDVAGAIVNRFGDRATYAYGASSNRHRNVMPNHLMQWSLIQWAKDQGCRVYDFRGVSPLRDGKLDSRLEGLNRFKEGFCPRYVEYIGEYDMVISPLMYRLWTLALPLVRRSLKARGRAEAAE